MKLAWVLVALIGSSAMASAEDAPGTVSPGVDTATLVTPKAVRPPSTPFFDARYECTGTILHQLRDGELESRVTFRFEVDKDNRVTGAVDRVGEPLNLPARNFQGQLRGRRDAKGAMVGGRLKIEWPYTLRGTGVQLQIMRETFIRVGPRINGFAKVKLRTSKHLYVAGNIRFDPTSHPSLDGLVHTAFVQATCEPVAG